MDSVSPFTDQRICCAFVMPRGAVSTSSMASPSSTTSMFTAPEAHLTLRFLTLAASTFADPISVPPSIPKRMAEHPPNPMDPRMSKPSAMMSVILTYDAVVSFVMMRPFR